MVEPLSVDTDGVRSLSDIHTDVAAGLGALSAGSPGAGDVAATHGTVASGVDTALTAALGSRSGTMSTTRTAGDQISELLKQAAISYERGDRRGAEAIRAAADSIARGETPSSPGAVSGGGVDAMGQAVGQLSQMGQQLGAPLQALAQPLQQLPQQVIQGIQQMAQTASPATDSDANPDDRGDETASRDRTEDRASPGAESGAGVAPVPEDEPAPPSISTRGGADRQPVK